ncbi:MAG: DUF3426 domain-containing protein [Oceanospirillaceae bacterium]|nr:DUF3426 domain-containing protein [Oceanospirillaceae bacterium]
MQDGLITECPECQTRFNVSEGQLQLANGKVRCGACLRVFDARAQQIGASEAGSPEPVLDSPVVASGTSDDTFSIETETPVGIGTPPPAETPLPGPEAAPRPAPAVQQWAPPPQPHPVPPEPSRPPQETTPEPSAEPPAPVRLMPSLSLNELHAEPLQLEREPEPASPAAILGWGLGCLLALVLLAAQLSWFNRLDWARQDQLAGFYEILCHQVQCNIPPRRDIAQIHNLQLVVRAHPEYQDALSVHLLLENDAGFEQPFPAIDLSFADIRGRTVASRRLEPADYLDPDLNPLRMDRSQPYQVNLEILDPGRRAVSYEVQLAPARL